MIGPRKQRIYAASGTVVLRADDCREVGRQETSVASKARLSTAGATAYHEAQGTEECAHRSDGRIRQAPCNHSS